MNIEPFIQPLYQVFLASPLILALVYLIMFIYTFLKDHKENMKYLEKFSLSIFSATSILILYTFAPQTGFFGNLLQSLNTYLFFIQTVIALFFILD
ncbi:MAG TPA: hypothetical protein DCY20_01800, partial [Firmicutes bacterium]|nr:hypothetical protein [Bacillota bacterium]